MIKELITFEKLPLVNSLVSNPNDAIELYDLKIGFDETTKLVHVIDNAPPEKLFPDDYVYDSSQSLTMVRHFKECAQMLKKAYPCKSVLEIGSNSGAFIKNFDHNAVCVEPCSNFAKKTNTMGYQTYDNFWSMALSENINREHGKRDLIFSANAISHIQELDDCLKAVHNTLADDGIFVVESPSFLDVLQENAFDQFYHEHQSYFSAIAFENILTKNKLKLFNIEWYPVHGGSYLFFACKDESTQHKKKSDNLNKWKNKEKNFGIDCHEGLLKRMNIMKNNMKEIKNLLTTLKSDNKTIVGYGASAKFVQVSNMCGLDNLIDFVIDTTPSKQNKLTPKSLLPISSPTKINMDEIDYFFLGAWNFKDEIFKKEANFLKRGGKFITHIPHVKVIEQ